MPDRGLPAPEVLVVEDDQLLRELLTETLAESGFKVRSAADADEALAIAAEVRRFDVLFTDVRLPGGMDGLELAAKVVQAGHCGAVIYATGYTYDPPRMVSPSIIFRKPYSLDAATAATRRMAEVGRISLESKTPPDRVGTARPAQVGSYSDPDVST